MPKQPPAPAPDIMADVSPQTGPPTTPPDGNPDNPIPLPFTPSQLSKFGIQGPIPPGSSVIATVRLTSTGEDPSNPTLELSAIGNVQPDDGSADLISLSNDAATNPPPINNGVPASGEPIPGIDDGTNLGGREYNVKKDGSAGDNISQNNGKEPDQEEEMLGYKPGKKKMPPISAKGALED